MPLRQQGGAPAKTAGEVAGPVDGKLAAHGGMKGARRHGLSLLLWVPMTKNRDFLREMSIEYSR